MKIDRKRILSYDKNRPRQRYADGTMEYEISELAYELFLELTGPAYSAINRAYSKTEREKNPKTEYLWASGHAQAKEFLTRYKNIVRDAIVPLAIITKHKTPYDDSQDQNTKEFKKLIVDNCCYMLYKKLHDYAPLLLPEDHIVPFEKVLETTFTSVKAKLLEALSYYEAEARYTEEDFVQD